MPEWAELSKSPSRAHCLLVCVRVGGLGWEQGDRDGDRDGVGEGERGIPPSS